MYGKFNNIIIKVIEFEIKRLKIFIFILFIMILAKIKINKAN